jgi:parallel beta-helix repeat protein
MMDGAPNIASQPRRAIVASAQPFWRRAAMRLLVVCAPAAGAATIVPDGTSSLPASGPQATITCPVAAIAISPGASIQTAVDRHPPGTIFCVKAGIHAISSHITPKSGDVFIGEYGAILDGSAWTTADPDEAAFRAHNQDIDDVTIRNLVIRHMPQKGIHALHRASDRWTIENNELTATRTAISAPNQSVVRANNIHHNTSGGYGAYRVVDVIFEHNEIAYNGGEQKIVGATDVSFRDNFVHHNAADGIWYDTDNTGSLIEGNRVEDNGRDGISYEVSARGVIRRNTVRRSAGSGIFIATSKNVEIAENALADNFRGIQYFLNCDAVGKGQVGFDLAENDAHGNTVIVSGGRGAYANGFAYVRSCPSAQIAPYVNGSKRLLFRDTRYVVPTRGARYWFWGPGGLSSLQSWFGAGSGLKSWKEWQALGHDTTGSVAE